LRSGIEEKHHKYGEYLAKHYLTGDEPFIIALSGRDIPYSADVLGNAPLILQTVFPIDEPTFEFSIDKDDEPRLTYPYRDHVKKASGAPVSTTVFTNPMHSNVSALIFSTSDGVNLPTVFGSDFVMLHNPLAAHPVARGFIKRGLEFWEVGGQAVRKDWNAV
jgi:hypothetical protein